jgi:hypothetical protein
MRCISSTGDSIPEHVRPWRTAVRSPETSPRDFGRGSPIVTIIFNANSHEFLVVVITHDELDASANKVEHFYRYMINLVVF